MAIGLTVKLLSDNAELKKGLRKAERDFDKFSRRIGSGLAKTFKAGGLALAAGLGAGVAAAGSLIHELESAQNNLTKATGATGDALKELVADARALLPQVPENLDEISKVLGEVNTQWQLSGKTQQDATKLMLDWARVTDTDGVQATFNLAAALRVFGEDASYADEALGDILKGTQGTGVAADAVLKQFAKFGPVLSGVGLSAEEASALLIQMGSAGIRVSTVMEGLGTFQTTMAKEGKDAQREFLRWIELFTLSEEGAYDAGEAARLFGTTALPLWEQLGRAGVIDPSAWGFGESTGYVEEQAEAVKTISERWKQAANVLRAAVLPAIVVASEWITGTMLPALQDKVVPAIQNAASELRDRVEPALAATAGWVQDTLVPAFKSELLPKIQALAGWLRNWVLADIKAIGVWVAQSLVPKTAEWAKTIGELAVGKIEDLAGWVGSMYEAFRSSDWKGAFDIFAAGPVDDQGKVPWWGRVAQLALLAAAFNVIAKSVRLVAGLAFKVGKAIASPFVSMQKAAAKLGTGVEKVLSVALKPLQLAVGGVTKAATKLWVVFARAGNTKLAAVLGRVVTTGFKVSRVLAKIAPAVGKVVGKVSVLATVGFAVVDTWKTWTDGAKSLTDKLADTAIAVSSVVAVIAVAVAGVAAWPVVLGAAIGAGIALVVKFRREIWDFAKRFKAVGLAVLAVVSGPFGLLAAGVTLLADKFGLLGKAGSAAASLADTAWSALQATLQKFGNHAKKLVKIAKSVGDAIGGTLLAVLHELADVFTTVAGFAKSVGDAIGGYIGREFRRSAGEAKALARGLGRLLSPVGSLANAIGGFLAGEVRKVVEDFKRLGSGLQAVGEWLGGFLAGEVRKVVEDFKRLGSGLAAVAGFLRGEFADAWQDITRVFGPVVSFLQGQFSNAWNDIKRVARGVASVAEEVWDPVVTQLERVIGWVNWLKNAMKQVGTKGQDAAGAIKTAFGGIKSAVEKALSGVGSIIGKLEDAASKAIEVYNAIPLLPNIPNPFKNGGSSGGDTPPTSGGGGFYTQRPGAAPSPSTNAGPGGHFYQPQQGSDFGSPANRGQTVNIYMPAGSDARAVFNAVQERQNRGQTLHGPGRV